MSDLERTDVMPVLETGSHDLPPDSGAARLIRELSEEQNALERLLEASRAETVALAEELAASRTAREAAERTARTATDAAALAAYRAPPVAPPAAATPVAPIATPSPPPSTPPAGPPAEWREPALLARAVAAEALSSRYLEALQSQEWTRGIREEGLRALEDELEAAEERIGGFAAERGALLSAIEALKLEHTARALAPPAAPPAAPNENALPGASAEPSPRIAELEAVAATLGRALEGQSSAAHLATSQLAALERAAGELKARVAYLEDELAATATRGEEHMRAARSADAALTATAQHVAEAGERVAEVERNAALAASAHAAEVASLKERLEQQTLLLARARGALEERELQVRRLERNASRRAAADGGEERGAATAGAAGAAATIGPARLEGRPLGMLRPIDGSEPRFLAIGRRTTIGRAPENDLCVPDPSVSRRHALIVIGSTGTIIEDLNSANGIAVNGRRIRHAHLNEGDIVALGTVRFVYAPAPLTQASA